MPSKSKQKMYRANSINRFTFRNLSKLATLKVLSIPANCISKESKAVVHDSFTIKSCFELRSTTIKTIIFSYQNSLKHKKVSRNNCKISILHELVTIQNSFTVKYFRNCEFLVIGSIPDSAAPSFKVAFFQNYIIFPEFWWKFEMNVLCNALLQETILQPDKRTALNYEKPYKFHPHTIFRSKHYW